MFPVGDDNTQRRTFPTVTIVLIVLNVLVFLAELAGGEQFIVNWAFIPAQFSNQPGANAVTIFSAMFLHGGWLHLIVNMIVLWSFGRGLEPVMGAFRFVVLYLATGVLAALAHGFVNEQANVILIGASGAIAGVLGAAVIAAPRLPVIFVIFPMPLWIAVIALVALHVAAIVFDWDPEIAWHAHLAGLAAGAILYPLLRRRPAN